MEEIFKDDKLLISGTDGVFRECDLILTLEMHGKHYLLYTDNSTDESGATRIFAGIYDPTGESNRLEQVETEEEWALLEFHLRSLAEEL